MQAPSHADIRLLPLEVLQHICKKIPADATQLTKEDVACLLNLRLAAPGPEGRRALGKAAARAIIMLRGGEGRGAIPAWAWQLYDGAVAAVLVYARTTDDVLRSLQEMPASVSRLVMACSTWSDRTHGVVEGILASRPAALGGSLLHLDLGNMRITQESADALLSGLHSLLDLKLLVLLWANAVWCPTVPARLQSFSIATVRTITRAGESDDEDYMLSYPKLDLAGLAASGKGLLRLRIGPETVILDNYLQLTKLQQLQQLEDITNDMRSGDEIGQLLDGLPSLQAAEFGRSTPVVLPTDTHHKPACALQLTRLVAWHGVLDLGWGRGALARMLPRLQSFSFRHRGLHAHKLLKALHGSQLRKLVLDIEVYHMPQRHLLLIPEAFPQLQHFEAWGASQVLDTPECYVGSDELLEALSQCEHLEVLLLLPEQNAQKMPDRIRARICGQALLVLAAGRCRKLRRVQLVGQSVSFSDLAALVGSSELSQLREVVVSTEERWDDWSRLQGQYANPNRRHGPDVERLQAYIASVPLAQALMAAAPAQVQQEAGQHAARHNASQTIAGWWQLSSADRGRAVEADLVRRQLQQCLRPGSELSAEFQGCRETLAQGKSQVRVAPPWFEVCPVRRAGRACACELCLAPSRHEGAW